MSLKSFQVGESGYILNKSDMNKFLNALRKYGQIIGPKQKGKWLRMELISDESELCYEGISWFTSKKHFFPEKQEIFSFKGNEIKKHNFFPKKVLFGLRMCDLNALAVNDKLFLEQQPVNENYKKYRENLTLVGLFCDKTQDKYCFCSSYDLKHLYDLCLFDRGDYFHLKVGSLKGEEVVKKLGFNDDSNYWKELPEGEMKLKTKDIKKFFDRNEIWKKGSDDCLSCGDCTTLCPSCLCFDVHDEVEVDMVSGVRFVEWDSCMYKHFTLVAGGHVYRNNRINRFKHRIYHKLDYFPEKFGEFMCTGCGRCIRGCPTKIDWVGLVNEMEAEK